MTLQEKLQELYASSNHRGTIHPDPVEFLHRYPRVEDREIVGLIAAGLAYGRVMQILKSVGVVLDRLGDTPSELVDATSATALKKLLRGIQHRWTTSDDVCDLLAGVKRTRLAHGSLSAGFVAGMDPGHVTVLPALCVWFARMQPGPLLPDPRKGSACKRLHLYLRWMVRSDEVDPGGWGQVPPSMLIVPLDVHMHRIARLLGMTRRKQADRRTALEVTAAFRALCPEDPVRYDFALTRFGIRDGMTEAAVRSEILGWGRLEHAPTKATR